MYSRHLAAPVAARIVERELHDPPRSGDGDRLDRDSGVVVRELAAVRLDPGDQLASRRSSLLVLDPRVQVLGVLADDHEIDVVESRANARICLAGTHLRVEVQALA